MKCTLCSCQLVSILLVLVTRLPFNTRRNNSANKTSGIYSYCKHFVLDHTVHFLLSLVNCAFLQGEFIQIDLAVHRCRSNNFSGVH